MQVSMALKLRGNIATPQPAEGSRFAVKQLLYVGIFYFAVVSAQRFGEVRN